MGSCLTRLPALSDSLWDSGRLGNRRAVLLPFLQPSSAFCSWAKTLQKGRKDYTENSILNVRRLCNLFFNKFKFCFSAITASNLRLLVYMSTSLNIDEASLLIQLIASARKK